MLFTILQIITTLVIAPPGTVASIDAIIPEPSEQVAEVRRLKLVFAGDIMGHGPQIQAAEIVENMHYDYTECFEYIRPVISAADIAVANLEVTLPGQPPYSGYPLFKSPDALAVALRHAGFNLLLTANNHSNDAGRLGVFQTINTLYKYGFYQTGSFQSAAEREAYYPLIVYKNGFKIAFLNYTYSTNGIATKPPMIVNTIDEAQIKQDLELTKAMQPDFIIVAMHWGNEYRQQYNKEQESLAKQMINWGTDLIVGAHPHVVQPIKWYTDPEGRKVPVAYSLGNFISNQRRPHTDGGILLEVELIKDPASGHTILNDCGYKTVWRYIHTKANGKKSFIVLPVDEYFTRPQAFLPLEDAARVKMKRYRNGVMALMEK